MCKTTNKVDGVSEADRKILDAVDIVCLNCIEDTLEDNACCDTCPVRKLADSINNGSQKV